MNSAKANNSSKVSSKMSILMIFSATFSVVVAKAEIMAASTLILEGQAVASNRNVNPLNKPKKKSLLSSIQQTWSNWTWAQFSNSTAERRSGFSTFTTPSWSNVRASRRSTSNWLKRCTGSPKLARLTASMKKNFVRSLGSSIFHNLWFSQRVFRTRVSATMGPWTGTQLRRPHRIRCRVLSVSWRQKISKVSNFVMLQNTTYCYSQIKNQPQPSTKLYPRNSWINYFSGR